jgi:MoxR-like ATPase
MKVGEIQEIGRKLVDSVGSVIVGKTAVLEDVFACILADGHILFEDFPGLAKTLLAKTYAQVLGCTFRRVQFTPDLLPADITGSYIFNREKSLFELRRGPVFTNILLGDEINRAPPKTQAALLEAMQERQVTLEGETHKLEAPFLVFATQNPIEYEGTYPLPEAQVDRFLVKLSVGYPSAGDEIEILSRRMRRGRDAADVPGIISPQTVLEMQKAVETVHVDADIEKYMVEIVRKTREDPLVEVGASPRGSLALLKLSRARAVISGRDYVIPDDVKRFTVPALSHRLVLKPDPWVRGLKGSSIVKEIVDKVPVPKAR